MILLHLLGVGVAVELETMFVYDVTEQEDVEDEQEWGMHRALGDALIQRKSWRTVIGREMGPEPCHEGAVLVMVTCDSRQERRMDWPLVSKATVRLSNVKISGRAECVWRGRMLSLTLRRAVSVLRCERNPN